jgi:hypothetical protein
MELFRDSYTGYEKPVGKEGHNFVITGDDQKLIKRLNQMPMDPLDLTIRCYDAALQQNIARERIRRSLREIQAKFESYYSDGDATSHMSQTDPNRSILNGRRLELQGFKDTVYHMWRSLTPLDLWMPSEASSSSLRLGNVHKFLDTIQMLKAHTAALNPKALSNFHNLYIDQKHAYYDAHYVTMRNVDFLKLVASFQARLEGLTKGNVPPSFTRLCQQIGDFHDVLLQYLQNTYRLALLHILTHARIKYYTRHEPKWEALKRQYPGRDQLPIPEYVSPNVVLVRTPSLICSVYFTIRHVCVLTAFRGAPLSSRTGGRDFRTPASVKHTRPRQARRFHRRCLHVSLASPRFSFGCNGKQLPPPRWRSREGGGYDCVFSPGFHSE